MKLKTHRVRGTKLSFLFLVRSADPADRRSDRQRDIIKGFWASSYFIMVTKLGVSCSGKNQMT